MKMKTRALWAGWLLGTVFTALLSTAQSAPQEDFRRAFESATPIAQSPKIDGAVLAGLQARGLSMAPTCSDAVFVRRAYLDVIGTLPEIAETEAFLADTRADKRALLVEHLLARPEFADYWSMKWCDLLRVKAEFPINLWPNAVQYYHRWIREALRQNMPYDAFARALLSSSGSNFRVPQVNFYRALQGRSPEAIAATVALTFMGVRLETWPENQRKAMEAFFSRIAYKKTGEWKEEIVCLDPAPAPAMETTFPSGDAVTIGPEDDPRAVFAQWLIKADNSWFTANICNRIWTWLMGRGIVHEPDDFRHDNPPSNPELLRVLQSELLAAQYDLRHLFRLILNSATYQQSSIPETDSPEARALFAFYPVRRLEAEVLLDAINQLTGGRDRYSSPIPEPFTYIPETQRAIAVAKDMFKQALSELQSEAKARPVGFLR